MSRLGDWARQLRGETFALYLAARDRRTPWYARLFLAFIVAYALSPIDLIPDFVPVLGYLDDAILIPVGIALALRMVPPAVIAKAREQAPCGIAAPPAVEIALDDVHSLTGGNKVFTNA